MQPKYRAVARLTCLALLCGSMAMGSVPAFAVPASEWTSHGPPGAAANAIAIDEAHPSTVYVGTPNGVWITNDAGESWQRSGLHDVYVLAVAVDPIRHRTIYAAGPPYEGSTIYKTLDGGATWIKSGRGLQTQDVSHLYISPFREGVVYASTRSDLYKTNDGARSWRPIPRTFPDPHLAFDPAHPSALLLGTVNGVFRSTDAGRDWTQKVDFTYVSALAIDPSEPNVALAGSADGNFRSTDGGKTWKRIPYLRPQLSQVAFARSNPQIVYAEAFGPGSTREILSSNDAGQTWFPHGNGVDSFASLGALTPNGLRAYAVGSGVFATTLSGRWIETDRGIIASSIAGIAVDASDPSRLFAYAPFSETSDGGASWLRIAGAPPFISALAVAPSDPSTLYAGSGSVLYRSSDGGGTWTGVSEIRNGLVRPHINSIVVDPTDADRLSLGVFHGGAYRSTDGGETLTRLPFPNDKGRVVQLAVDPANTARLLAASNADGAFESDDAGLTWRRITPVGLGAISVALRPGTRTVYVGTNGAGVWVTRDDGSTWAQGAGVDGRGGVHSIVVDPVAPSTVFVGVNGHGVYRSDDNGATWTPFDDGLGSSFVTTLAITSDGSALHAGTRETGVFDTPL